MVRPGLLRALVLLTAGFAAAVVQAVAPSASLQAATTVAPATTGVATSTAATTAATSVAATTAATATTATAPTVAGSPATTSTAAPSPRSSSVSARRFGAPVAAGRGAAVQVFVPGSPVAGSPDSPSSLASYAYPGDGSIVITGAASAGSSESAGADSASASASAAATNVSIFGGEITADTVGARIAASVSGGLPQGAPGSGSAVNVQVLGQALRSGSLAAGNWGVVTLDKRVLSTVGPSGVAVHDAAVAGLDVTLLAPHGGLPAGSEIEVAYAEVSAATAPPPLPPLRTEVVRGILPGDRPQLLPPPSGPLLGVPQIETPPLGAGSFVFPVFGRIRVSDAFGTLAPGVDYVHGAALDGSLGEPVLAVADGTLFRVGWTRRGGNVLWLRDRDGNEFAYAHLAAFAAATSEGAHVQAGEVVGFMGESGGGAAALAFEVHPVSLLYLGPQGAVDPGSYLAGWRRLQSVTLGLGPAWLPSIPGTLRAPEPGAFLTGSTDLATAGAGAAALRDALAGGGGG